MLHVNRRHFLQQFGLVAGALVGSSLFSKIDAFAASRRPRHVVIIGAGMAGLCAAYELQKRGHSSVILEADASHVGGRVRTLRFDDGLYGEAGAMRIPSKHQLTRQYVREFGLPLRKFVSGNKEAYYHLRGRRARIKDGGQLGALYDLAPAERGKSPHDLWSELVLKRLGAMSDEEKRELASLAPQSELVRSLDAVTLDQFARSAGMSREALEYLASAFQLESVANSAAVSAFFHEEADEIWSTDLHEIVGGFDRLPHAFSARLQNKPRMGCEVVAIEQDQTRKRAAAIFRQAGKQHREEGDFLLCTLPLPILRTLDVSPAFSGPKQRAIRQLQYESATKVLALAERRFWEADDGIYGGTSHADLPSQATVYPSDNAQARDPNVSSRPAVFLASFTWGTAARAVDKLPPSERAPFQIRQVAKIHPQLHEPGMIRRSIAWSWDDHRWSRGAFAFPAPGQRHLQRDAAAPEGRAYFAGEHCSINHAWVQGALESALLAVEGIMSAA